MTFVSALFSRTHFNANYFAVLNESFKVISLFSYQSSLFVVFATAFIFYQKHLSLSTTFLFFFVVVSSDSLFILSPAIGFVNNFFYFSLLSFQATTCLFYHRRSALSTTFFFPSRSFSRTDCRIPCRLLSLLFFCMCRCISDSLLIIALLPAEVNTFRADLSK